MHAAAAKPGGIGGVPQSVGKDFSEADKPGKLPTRKKPTSERLYGKKGYAEGGEVDSPSPVDAYNSSYRWSRLMHGEKDSDEIAKGAADSARARQAKAQDDENFSKANKEGKPLTVGGTTYYPDLGKHPPPKEAKGGEIKEVAGKPIGNDDGIIAAQRGEFVVKKSAVKKLGSAVLNEINKGRLPSERLYGSRKAVRHA